MTAAGCIRRRACGGRSASSAPNVFILDGGLPAWKAEGRATEAGEVKRPPRTFNAEYESTGAVALRTTVALNDDSAQVVDARRPAASPAASRSRAPACVPATCRARSMCRSPSWSRTAALPRPSGSRRRFGEASRRRHGEAGDHQLRLRRHRRHPHLRARRARQAGRPRL